MAVVKHQLTAGIDKITGAAGKDLFLGPLDSANPTLQMPDRLDGGKGLDTLRAEISGAMGSPVMKRIESGIFELVDGSTTTLSLDKARQMHRVTIQGSESILSTILNIEGAASTDVLRVLNGDLNDQFIVTGVDSKANKTLSLELAGTESSISVQTFNGTPFRSVEIELSHTLDATLWGSAFSARDVTIKSVGGGQNRLVYDPGMYMGTVRNLTIEGNTSLRLNITSSEIFEHLYSVDLTGMKAITEITVGGEKLMSVMGGKGSDFVRLSELGGTTKHKAEVSLGAGIDGVTLLSGCYDAATQRIDGGKGGDTIGFVGGIDNLWKGIRNFEAAYFYDAIGTYDLHGMDMQLNLGNTAGAVTFDNLKSGSLVTLLGDFTTFLTLEVEGAKESRRESVTLELTVGMTTYGNSIVGLIAPDLSALRIESAHHDHTMYLTSLGSATDGATLSIAGDYALFLHSTNGSTQYIDQIKITNSAGADLSGLEDGNQSIVSTGATITGGDGDDVLVGGAGRDKISTGAGNNSVIGSLGQDEITLAVGVGANTIIYRASSESAYQLGKDTILNFDSADRIDVSAIGHVAFAGNFTNNAAGIAALSASVASAFFNTTNDTLYIDFDHDKALGQSHDMEIVLTGFTNFLSSYLIS